MIGRGSGERDWVGKKWEVGFKKSGNFEN